MARKPSNGMTTRSRMRGKSVYGRKPTARHCSTISRTAQNDIKPDETPVMERIVMEQGGMPEELAVIVVQMAKTQNQLFGSTENYLVTREFERIATHEQKLALLDCLFAVTAADENITAEEDNVVKQIASELKLSHDDYIAARSRFREYLAVLKRGQHNE